MSEKPFAFRLSHALSSLVAGEPNWWSESLTPGDWDPFTAPLDPSTALTADSFRTCAGEAKSRAISSQPFDDYLDHVLDPGTGLDATSVSTWSAFRQISESLLTDRIIFKVGEDQTVKVRTYLVGRVADGSVAGIHAVSVET
jgi:nuclease A inhibitor-like protein